MSHAAPNPTRGAKAIRTVRFWAAPIAVTLALMSALAGLYLGGILNPATNLRHFPIAVVNEDAGPTGKQIVDGLVAGLDKNKFDIRVVSHDEARHLLDTARVYGEAVIPPTFSSNLREYGASAVAPGHVERPSITISTNPRAGTLGSNIAGQTLTQAMAAANSKVGQRLTADVAADTGDAPPHNRSPGERLRRNGKVQGLPVDQRISATEVKVRGDCLSGVVVSCRFEAP